MSSPFATRAVALISLFSLASASPKPAWKRQAADNTTAPFNLGTGVPTTTVSTLVTVAPTSAGAAPLTSQAVLTCKNDLIAAGFAAEPADATSFCSSFLGYPHLTITTNGITETVTSTAVTTNTITTATLTTTTACDTSISTVTTILTTAAPVRRDAMLLTARAALPSAHPFMKLERQASSELASNDCSTLLASFSTDCSCLFIPTSTTTVCGTETVFRTLSETVNVLTSAVASTCSGTSVITSTQTLYVFTEASTTSTSTLPPTDIPTTSGLNSSVPAVTSTPFTSIPAPTNSSAPVTSSGGALTQNSTSTSLFPVPPFPTTSTELRVGTVTITIPGLTTLTDSFSYGPNGTTVTIPGATITYPPVTTTVVITETVTPIPANTSAPFSNGTSPSVPLTTGPSSPSTGVIPPVNTTSAPYTYTNGTDLTTPAPTAPSSGLPTQPANLTTPPFSIGNETRTGGFPTGTGTPITSSAAPFPNGNLTTSGPTGTGTGSLPLGTGLTSVPYFVPNATRTFNGTITTTYTTLLTTTAVQVYNTTVTTAIPTVYVSVITFGTASTTTYQGPTIFPSGTGSIVFSEPVPSDYTWTPPALSTGASLSLDFPDANTFITAPTPAETVAAVKRFEGARRA